MGYDLVKFDLNLLLAFDTLMTERGVTRAGKVLGITQAAMSNTLRRLREIFDDPLFVKTGQRMEPTAKAMELSTPISQALFHVRQALDQERFEAHRATQVFRIGTVDYAAASLLPLLLPQLQQDAPGISLEVVDVGGEGEVSVLESGTVDLVFSRFQWVPPKVLLHRFFMWEYVCLARQNHPLIPGGKLTVEAMSQARFVHYYPAGMDSTVVDEALAEMGRQRRIVARLSTFGMVPFLVAGSDLMAIMPEGTAHYVAPPLGLQVVRLPFKTSKLRLAMAWHPRSEKNPANIWLRNQIRVLMENLQGNWEKGLG